MFPLADARGRVRGFQARQLDPENDPLRAKYVNSPEGDLFRKGDLLYGLDLARQAIAKQDRAVIVEGNPDVIALRQAGFEPVVAAMGTALTEAHLRELQRLTRNLWLCFDADAAGQEATIRGMELAIGQGFKIRVVSLPPGTDPADDPTDFESRLDAAEAYLSYRVRVEIERLLPDRQRAFERVREVARTVRGIAGAPGRGAARRGSARAPRRAPGRPCAGGSRPQRRADDEGARGGRAARARRACRRPRAPAARARARRLPAEHFDVELHRRVREHLVSGLGAPPAEPATPGQKTGTPPASRGPPTASWSPRSPSSTRAPPRRRSTRRAPSRRSSACSERAVERELAGSRDDSRRTTELQQQLARIREAIAELS